MPPKTPKGPRTQSRTQYKTAPKAKTSSKTEFKRHAQEKASLTPRKEAKSAPKLKKEEPKLKEAPRTRRRRATKARTQGPERLQKLIAAAGITSRRKAEELIIQGRVTVNRKTVTELGAKADPSTDRIEVDGKSIATPESGLKVYILLNKPKGVISSVADPLKRPVVTDLVRVKQRVFPVGRLDFDAEGVIILTNDGELTNKLIHPKFNIPKKYLVKVSDVPDQRDLDRLESGVNLEDGKTLPAKARFIKKTQENAWIELTVTEGRNRLVKRMCMAVGHSVLKLKRIEFAGIKLGKLEPGQSRFLTEKEVEMLKGL